VTLRRLLNAAVLTAPFALPTGPAWALCPDFGLPEGTEIAELETNLGSICLELLSEEAPITVENFIGYVERGDYDGTFLHRSLPGFAVQGGGFGLDDQNDITSVPTQSAIVNEPCERDAMQGGVEICSDRGNERGTVAMAKVAMQPNSATSQWFINLADNRANLDNQNGGFSVFARVLGDGMDLVGEIADLPTATTERMYWLDPLFVRARPGLFSDTPAQAVVPLLPESPDFGCFDPERLAAVVDPDTGVGPNDLVPDPITGDVFFFVGADCATPIDPGTFMAQPGPETCPEDSQQTLAVDAPINPVTGTNPQGAPFSADFDGDGAADVFELSCPQKEEALDRREAWRADFEARFAPELVVIERATIVEVPEPRAEALAAGALAALLGLRRIRRRRTR